MFSSLVSKAVRTLSLEDEIVLFLEKTVFCLLKIFDNRRQLVVFKIQKKKKKMGSLFFFPYKMQRCNGFLQSGHHLGYSYGSGSEWMIGGSRAEVVIKTTDCLGLLSIY